MTLQRLIRISRRRIVCLAFIRLAYLVLSSASEAQTTSTAPPAWLLDHAGAGGQMRLLWKTEPGVRYDLWTSGDLNQWTRPAGFPALADGLSQEFAFGPAERGFFRITAIDEQPPTVTDPFPSADGFGVARSAAITVRLDDRSGINASSIRLTLTTGGGGALALNLTSPGMSFVDGVLRFDPGGTPLGNYGDTVTVKLEAADMTGNLVTYGWSFTLAPQAQTAGNVFVFGSPQAQSIGQQIAGPAAFLGSRIAQGPIVRQQGTASWHIASVLPDQIIIGYSGATPPQFSAGQLVCNLVPTAENEVFYRKINVVQNDPTAATLTLLTEDISLDNFVLEGGITISDDSVIFPLDGARKFVSRFKAGGTITFPRLGFDLSGSSLKLRPDGYEASVLGVTVSKGDQPPWLEIEATDWAWWFTPSLKAAIEFKLFGGFKSFEAVAKGDLSVRNTFDVHTVAAGVKAKATVFDLPSAKEPKEVVYLGQIGPIPVYALLKFDFKVEVEAEAKALLNLSFTYDQNFTGSFGLSYHKDSGLKWIKGFEIGTPVFRSNASLSGELSATVTLKPEAEFLIYAAAGVSAGVEPHLGATITALISSGFDGKLEAGLDFNLAPAGPLLHSLEGKFDLSFPIWSGEWPLNVDKLTFTTQPKSQTVAPGENVSFTCVLNSRLAEFQWFRNGNPIPGETSQTLHLWRVTTAFAGKYSVRANEAGETAYSKEASLTVQVPTPSTIDTDGDGLPDSVETNTGVWISRSNTGTNPYKWDTDGDGLSDGVETHTFVYVSPSDTGTDPNLYDTDFDGVGDGAEVLIGTDPNAGVPPPPQHSWISAGGLHSLFIKTDGTLWGMGLNYWDELGQAGQGLYKVPISIATGVTEVSAGYAESFFVKNDHSLWRVGDNSWSPGGDSYRVVWPPVQVASDVATVSCGWANGLFIKADGMLWGIGNNYSGQLGDGTTTLRNSPVVVTAGVAQIAGGYRHSLFVKNDGILWGTGVNAEGELGDGTATSHYLPLRIAAGVIHSAAGEQARSSYFIRNGGTLWGCGDNRYNQISSTAGAYVYTPVLIATDVAQVAGGGSHVLFVKNDGTLWGRGYNAQGQLGDGTTTNRSTPVLVATGVSSVAAGGAHSLFTKTEGTLWAMGYNQYGQLGDGTTTDRATPVLVATGVKTTDSAEAAAVEFQKDTRSVIATER